MRIKIQQMTAKLINSFVYLIILLCLTTLSLSAQEIKFKVNGVPDTTLHLVKYMGSKLYYADTAQIKKGVVVFDGSKHDAGIMALLMPNQKYFEFIFNDEDVYIETKAPNLVDNIKVKKSKENKVFYEYLNYMKNTQAKGKALSEKKNATEDEAEKEALKNQLKEMGSHVREKQLEFVNNNDDLFVSKVIKASTDIKIPDAPENKENEKDSTFEYRYFREHYFDHIDLTDDRMVRTPVLQKKLEYYYSPKMLLQQPDTIVKYMSKVIDQIPEGSLMYRFVVSTVTSDLEKSNIMGMDKAFNLMLDKYYCSTDEEGNKKAFWMEEEKLDEICKNTKTRLRLVQGVVPPNLMLPDSTNQKWYDIYSLESDYTILYFWDPGCGHCKKETPKLQKLYTEKLKDRNVEIFAVGKATGDDFEDWKKFIQAKGLTFINVGLTEQIYQQAKEDPLSLIPSKTSLESLNYQETYDIFSTPRVWILDKDKKIIAKRLNVAQIEDYLDRLQGFEDSEKLFEVDNKKNPQLE